MSAGGTTVVRARIEQVRPLAVAYRDESMAASADGRPWDPPLPQGGIFWLARDADGEAVGYVAGTMRPSGCTVGPVYVVPSERRSGVGEDLLLAVQAWASDTRVPVVEISVAHENEAGRSFLEALGYVPRRVLMSLTPEDAKPRG